VPGLISERSGSADEGADGLGKPFGLPELGYLLSVPALSSCLRCLPDPAEREGEELLVRPPVLVAEEVEGAGEGAEE